MLKGKKQRKFFAEKDRQWQDRLKAFGRDQGADALHELRVAVKKIKALARLSEDCVGSGAQKDFALLKKMFRQAGAVRDLGNRLQLLEHLNPAVSRYKEEQTELKQCETEVFLRHLREYRKKGRKAGRRLLGDAHSIPTGRIRKWYARQLIHTSVLLTESGDRLHKARKKIKDLLYVLKILPSRLAGELGLDSGYLDRLQDAIGKWHDATVLVGSWAGKDPNGSQAIVEECREKEAVVRRLAGDFFLHAHTG